jgi:Flp pilus assembly pilin Flp
MSHQASHDRRPDPADDRGASLVEYALLLALIAVVCLLSLAFLGGQLKGSYDRSGQSIVSVGG